jgi:hypothetical protein
MIIRQFNKEKVAQYKLIFPEDPRTDDEILKAIQYVEENKNKYMELWINKQVNTNYKGRI